MSGRSAVRACATIGLASVATLLWSAPLKSQEGAAILFENVTLIDGTGRPPIAGSFVLIQDDRISRISRVPIDVGDGVRRVDGRGKFLIPGLMDMHVHLRGGRGGGGGGGGGRPNERVGVQALHGFLYSGFTSIYDAGNNPDFIFSLRERERTGQISSPRIFAAGGVVTVPGGHGGGSSATLVTRWPEDMAKLDAHLAREPDMIKFTFDEHGWGTRPLIPLLPVGLMEQVGRYVNERGIRTTVHISHEFRARQAMAAGINTLAHPVIQGPISQGFVNLMAATKTPMVSTLTIGEGYSRLVEHPEFLDQPLYRAVYEPAVIERLKGDIREQYAARSWTTWMKVMTPVAQENLRQIDAAGGVVVLGSDQSSGPASHRELELMVAGGIPPLQAIRIGTLNAAIFLGRERELGSIEEGKFADVVLLEADPLQDIRNVQRIELVVKDGAIVDRAALDLPVNGR